MRLKGFSLNADGTDMATSGSTTFLYQADDERYDTGFWIIVYYSKNATETNCVENEALEMKDSLDRFTFRNKVRPRLFVFSCTNHLSNVRSSPKSTTSCISPMSVLIQSTGHS